MAMNGRRIAVAIAAVGLAGALAACEREARPFQGRTAAGSAPGEGPNPYRNNAWGVSEGKRLFGFYNCAGCHANGGGGMGPALMDERWIYGRGDAEIFETIVKGRPNGMPAFGRRIPESQVWMLVGYVQSLSGQLPNAVLPARADHMRASAPENVRGARVPKDGSR